MSQEKTSYQKMLDSLCVQDESQLKEMFHDMVDIGGIESVEKLFDAADEFLAEYEEDTDTDSDDISDEEDARQVDAARMASEARAINRGEF